MSQRPDPTLEATTSPQPAGDTEPSGNDSPTNRSKIIDTVETHPRAYDRWTPDDETALVDLLRHQVSWEEIAEQFGRTPDAVKSRARRIAFREVFGRTLPDYEHYARDGAPWTNEEVSHLIALISSASSWAEIGDRLQREPAACRRRAEAEALDQLIDAPTTNPC